MVTPQTAPADASSFVYARLSEEFGARLEPGTIRRVCDEEVAGFEGTKVKDFVPILAWRRARARLREQVPSSPGPAIHAYGHASTRSENPQAGPGDRLDLT